jgi:hypothetical protein
MPHYEGKDAHLPQPADAKQEIDTHPDHPANITGQTLGRRSRLQELQDYLDGTADPETAARIEADLRDPDNAFARMLRGMSEHLPGDDPCDIDFSQFFTEVEFRDLPPLPPAEE